MCGIQITREKNNEIKHRGLFHHEKQLKDDWIVHFSSLPLSSYLKGITQPVDLDEDHFFVFNGEIFNYLEFGDYFSDVHYLKIALLKYLKDKEMFVLSDYIRWDGFWAIVIVNKKNNVADIFVDPLGKKQLYFNENGICSEIKPLMDKKTRLQDYELNNIINNKELTPFSNVYRFTPGMLYEYDFNKSEVISKSILTLNFFKKTNSTSLYDLIDKSVIQRTKNRINEISLFLSGGLDSNIILYHLIKNNFIPEILTIENSEEVEIDFITSWYKKQLGVDLHIKKLKIRNDFDISEIVRKYEHPIDYGSLIPQYLLCENTSNSVVLTGDGADEVFGGYKRNLIHDTQNFDLFTEIPYYHNLRLDRIFMSFTIENRAPFLSFDVIRYGLSLSWKQRRNKKHLRETYKKLLHDEIINGTKIPLRLLKDKDKNSELIKATFNKTKWEV